MGYCMSLFPRSKCSADKIFVNFPRAVRGLIRLDRMQMFYFKDRTKKNSEISYDSIFIFWSCRAVHSSIGKSFPSKLFASILVFKRNWKINAYFGVSIGECPIFVKNLREDRHYIFLLYMNSAIDFC